MVIIKTLSMDNIVPKGIKIETIGDTKTIITTDKKELVFSDYFGIFFVGFGFCFWVFGLTVEGFTEFYKMFSIVSLGLLGFLFISLVASFKEQQIITITGEFIEIRRKKLFFSSKEILYRKLIEKIDIKELSFPTLTIPSIVILLKLSCNFGFYEVPRIVYRGKDVYILANFNISIRRWIIEYLKNE